MKKTILALLSILMAVSASAAAHFVDALKSGQKQTVVCYGTSLTAQSHYWVDDLKTALEKRWPGQATVINAGQSGKNSAYGLQNVQSQVVAKNPDAVLLEFSMNDAADSLNSGKTPAQALAAAEANLKAIIAAITTAKPSVEIILETMNPYLRVEGSSLSNRTDLDAHIAMYRRVASENGYLLIDHYPAWQRLLADRPEQYLKLVPDGVHPNAAGCTRMILPTVLRTLGVDEVESARELPVIRDVDVVVVGGTFAAVSAAVSAKNAGASVFLAAPRRNLGEEIVLPRRLAPSAADEPITDAAFSSLAGREGTASFTYTADATPNSAKPDANNAKLKDNVCSSAASASVQYDGETVTWTITASGTDPISKVALHYYYRPTNGDFNVASIALQASADGTTYANVSGTVSDSTDARGLEYGDSCLVKTLVLEAPLTARHLKLTATRTSDAKRMLIGEIRLLTSSVSTTPLAPLVYEKALDQALLGAEVPFLAGTTACDVLKDGAGRVSGVVLANKSGRQAVRAKVVIDATDKGSVARKLCAVRAIPSDNETAFTMTVIAKSGLAWALPDYTVTESAATQGTIKLYTGGDTSMIPSDAETEYPASLYTFTKRFPLATGDWLAVNDIVRQIKTDTWTKSYADGSEVPFYVTPEQMIGETRVTSWTDSAVVPLGAFKPQGVNGLYVLGQFADLDRALADKLSLPGVEVALGKRLGAAAAQEAAARGSLGTLTVGHVATSASSVVVKERLERPLGIGSQKTGTVVSAGDELPVLAVADIAILGMGTAGGPAAIAALGKGKSVIGIDYLHTMGGVTTEGRIGKYYKGFNRGFSKNVMDVGVLKTGWNFSMAKAEWARRTITTNALAQVIFGSHVEGVLTDGTDAKGRAKVRGLVVVLPDGTRGVVRASVVIDCSGNAEVAHMAGCETQFLEGREFSMQGAGTSYHVLGNSYFNTDFGFLNTSDAGDLSNFGLRARLGANATRYNVGDPSATSRERRRIVGDIVVNERDILRRRKWSDTIMHGKSDYDMHGFSVSDALMYRERPHGTEFQAELPYRALIPAELDGVLATGLGISATRDAMPIIRMQRDVQNQGHAAGLAAAMALTTGDLRTIDIRTLQNELVAIGSLDSAVLKDTDDTVTSEALQKAVTGLTTASFTGIEKILERPTDAKPLLRSAYDGATTDDARLACAIVLVLVGDNTHLADIVTAAQSADWTKGFDFRGLGNYGRQTAPVDYLIHALVKSRDATTVVPVLKTFIEKLVDANGDAAKLSHIRMLTLAVEDLNSRELFDALVTTLARAKTVTGWSRSAAKDIPAHDTSGNDNSTDDKERTRSIIELALARTLARCGETTGAEILAAYQEDARTIYSSYATLALGLPALTLEGLPGEETPTEPVVIEKPLASVTDGGFEPVTALTTTDRNSQDKRSTKAQDWLKENLPSWTFDAADNNGSGICNNGSYFSNNSQLNNLVQGNGHCAFLRIAANDVGPGRISRTITAPASNTTFTVSCRLAERYFEGKAYTGRVKLQLDGVDIPGSTSELVSKWSIWATHEVTFTVAEAGDHTLSFVAVANDAGTCDILLDEVQIGWSYTLNSIKGMMMSLR